MNFTNALSAYGTSEFHTAVTDQLEKNYSALPLGPACSRGGYPQTGAEITIREVSVSNERIAVEFTVRFNEAFSSGCSEAPCEVARWIDCRAFIRKDDGSATVEAVEPERPEEF